MTLPVEVNPTLMYKSGGGYQIPRSLRLRRSASAYLSRSVTSAGNRKTWTWSGWVKLANSVQQTIINTAGSSDSNFGQISILGEQLLVAGYSSVWRQTTQVLRDPSAWYHIVVAFDTTQATAANRVRVYINGSEVTSFVTNNAPTLNADYGINSVITHYVGKNLSSYNYFDGYITEVNFIDGQALTPSSFGETDFTTGVWTPKKYTGSYGTNGFYLNFSDNSAATAAAIGKDYSGNGNNFTPINIVTSGGATSYSGYFNGSSYVQPPSSTNLQLGSGDFTVEMWFKKTGGPTQQCLFGYDTNDPYFEFDNSKVRMIINGVDIVGTTTIATNVWYHAAWVRVGGQIRIYVNGTLEASATAAGNLTQSQPRIGMRRDGTTPFTGYISNLRVVKGTALYTSNFSPPTSALTAVSGTQLLTLQSATIVDNSANAFSLTVSGATASSAEQPFPPASSTDSMIDTPTPYDDGSTGRGNYCTLNNASTQVTLSNANLTATAVNTGDQRLATGTLGWDTGKWYYELRADTVPNANYFIVGLVRSASQHFSMSGSNYPGKYAGGWGLQFGSTTYFEENGVETSSATASNLSVGDIIQVAFDATAGKWWIGVNNTWLFSGNPASGTNPIHSSLTGQIIPAFGLYGTGASLAAASANFGQRPFAYTPPSGFKALNTQNLPVPTIVKPSTKFNTVLYTGNGSTQTISGLGFSPDLVWIKSRSLVEDHALFDTVRGSGKYVKSNATSTEFNLSSTLNTFNSDGFTLGSAAITNTSSATYAAWAWDEGVTPGFDVVTYTGTGANRTVAHNLGIAPAMMIVKNRDSAQNWVVYHKNSNATPQNYILRLNTTDAALASSGSFNNTAPTSTEFTVGTLPALNGSGNNMLAYLWAEVPGFSKFGSYTGNGSADGPFVYCGFRPRFLLVKLASTSTTSWAIYDSARNTFNIEQNSLFADLSNAELVNAANAIDFLSNGFKVRTTNATWNFSNGTMIFAAFAEHPFKYALAR